MPPRNKGDVSIADGLPLNKTEAMEQILDRLEALTDKRYLLPPRAVAVCSRVDSLLDLSKVMERLTTKYFLVSTLAPGVCYLICLWNCPIEANIPTTTSR